MARVCAPDRLRAHCAGSCPSRSSARARFLMVASSAAIGVTSAPSSSRSCRSLIVAGRVAVWWPRSRNTRVARCAHGCCCCCCSCSVSRSGRARGNLTATRFAVRLQLARSDGRPTCASGHRVGVRGEDHRSSAAPNVPAGGPLIGHGRQMERVDVPCRYPDRGTSTVARRKANHRGVGDVVRPLRRPPPVLGCRWQDGSGVLCRSRLRRTPTDGFRGVRFVRRRASVSRRDRAPEGHSRMGRLADVVAARDSGCRIGRRPCFSCAAWCWRFCLHSMSVVYARRWGPWRLAGV